MRQRVGFSWWTSSLARIGPEACHYFKCRASVPDSPAVAPVAAMNAISPQEAKPRGQPACAHTETRMALLLPHDRAERLFLRLENVMRVITKSAVLAVAVAGLFASTAHAQERLIASI